MPRLRRRLGPAIVAAAANVRNLNNKEVQYLVDFIWGKGIRMRNHINKTGTVFSFIYRRGGLEMKKQYTDRGGRTKIFVCDKTQEFIFYERGINMHITSTIRRVYDSFKLCISEEGVFR